MEGEEIDWKWLTSSAAAHKPEIVEFGHLIAHHGGAVAQFGTEVLVVAGPDSDHRAVADVPERDHLEGARERFVRAPVVRQGGTQEVRTVGANCNEGRIGKQ